ncbi:sterol desaturase family protein [Reinekea marina]|uniref:Sterol desaturase family protein n=1 Tax=Reinekea marina TaxID=1310421 RepID=A0ABV7WT86_9GAMM|nr:sterol desaturase family protein [Reinekea marina]MDN3648095.1 sterol desaturase family protein [Reinekea marina]
MYQYKKRQVTPRPDKELRLENGRLGGYFSLLLGFSSLLAVLAYLFPSYLTTAELRAIYNIGDLQYILKYGMWLSLGFGLTNFIINKKKRLGFAGVSLTLIAFALAANVSPSGSTEPFPLAIGVDWLVIALLGSFFIFTSLEKLFPKYRDQVVLRDEWKTDFFYFCVNHLLISVFLLFGNFVVSSFDWVANPTLHNWVLALPLALQVLLLVICADFVLYWEHRLFHEHKKLWPFHAVHHSVETMDWLAGSRSHIVHTLVERSLVLVVLHLLGASKVALDIYVIIAAIQAIVIHCNMKIHWGVLKYILVTPQFHHWHHSSEEPAIDTNYAAHTTLFDWVFGTYHMPKGVWPAKYGTTKPLPRGYFKQMWYPFRKLLG